MENRDFVITSLQPWDIEIGSTIKNTAMEISRHNRVLYINTPLDITAWRNRSARINAHRVAAMQGREPRVRQVNDNMWVVDCPFMVLPVSKLPWNWLFDAVNRYNNRRIGKYLQGVIKEFAVKDFIHLIDTDIFRSQYLKKWLNPAVTVYYCRDFVIGDKYWLRHGRREEDKLARKADVVLANSTYFAERFRTLNANTYPIETGVNLSVYDASKHYDVPEDIKGIKRPVVGYMGTVNSTRLDIPLLEQLAMRCPQWSFVFVGPEDDVFKASRLHSMGNVHFLGRKETGEVPAYVEAFDVCINPQLVNDVTIGNYPLKADEYLAMGKPMVATVTHTMRDVFGDYTHLATGCDEYVSALEQALAEVGDEQLRSRRIAFAHTHSWENSVKKIYKIIENYESKK